LKVRLEGQGRLEGKLNLAANILRSRVHLPNKETVVLAWFARLIDVKYLTRAPAEEMRQIWEALSVSLHHVKDVAARKNRAGGEEVKVSIEFLLNHIEQVDMSNQTILGCIKILLTLSPSSEPSDKSALLKLMPKLLDNADDNVPLVPTILEILDELPKLEAESESGKLLAKMSLSYAARDSETLQKITRKVLLQNTADYAEFFSGLFSVQAVKNDRSDSVNRLLQFINEGGDLAWLLGLIQSGDLNWLRANLFCLAAHLHGVGAVINEESLALVQITPEASPSTDALCNLVKSSLPLDISHVYRAEFTAGSLLSTVVKIILDKVGLTDATCAVIAVLNIHHPMLLEPLVTQLMLTKLRSGEPAPQLTRTLFSLVVKLRQLPKMVSKLLMQLRLSSGGMEYVWKHEDLEAFEDAVLQVPRVQCLEMWKTLVYHLSTDHAPGAESGEEAGVRCWAVATPLLTALLRRAQLADHNLPAQLSVRVTELLRDTVEKILSPLLKLLRFQEDPLFAGLACVVLELAELISTYRNVDFSVADEFRSKLIKKILKQKQLGGYTSLILLQLRLGGPGRDKIWKTFHTELLTAPATLPRLLDLVPPQYLADVRVGEEAWSGDREDPRLAALLIFPHLGAMASGEYSEPLLSQEVWSQPEQWNSLQSDLGLVIQNILQKLLDQSLTSSHQITPPSSSALERLEILPLETLPPVLKLAATGLGLVRLFHPGGGGGTEAVISRFLCRCLEDTDIFRYLNAAAVAEAALRLDQQSENTAVLLLLRVLAGEMVRYRKMLSELVEGFPSVLQAGMVAGRANYLEFGVSLLHRLTPILLDKNTKLEKRQMADKLAVLISKAVMKHGKKADLLCPRSVLLRAATLMVRVYGSGEAGIGAREGVNKLEKFVRKVLSNAMGGGRKEVLALVNSILQLDNKDILDILNPDIMQQVRTIALDNLDYDEGNNFISSLLHNGTTMPEVEKIFAHSTDPRTQLKLATVLIASKIQDSVRPLISPHLETSVINLILSEAIGPEDKISLADRLVSSMPALVSSSIETSVLASLLAHNIPLSSRSLKCFVTLVSNRPQLAVRQLPLLTYSLRQHLNALTEDTGSSSEEKAQLCRCMQQLTSLVKRRKGDWGNVAPYLVADILSASVHLTDHNLKQLLTSATHNLLDICETHSHEYLSANLPPAVNEVFKIVLQNYKTNYKFTGHV